MIEQPLDGWTAAQREGLAFLLDDAGIAATWGPNSVSVPEGELPRVQRFVTFLENGRVAGADPVPRVAGTSSAWDDPAEPQLLFADDLGITAVASPGLRLGGALVDGLIYFVAGLPLLLLGGRTAYWIDFSLIAIYQVTMVGLLGQTLGNMAVQTRVVAVHDQGVPGLRASFIRWLVVAVPVLLSLVAAWIGAVSFLWDLVVYLPILSGPSHRGLHDRAAGVMVLDNRLAPVGPAATRADAPRDGVTD